MLLIILWFLFLSITIEASWLMNRGCNELFTDPAGVIQFTDPYADLRSWTLYCEYNVTVKKSSKILVTLLSISMNSTAKNCGDSFISLKDGLLESSPSLGSDKYCSDEQHGSLLTSGNELNIRTAIELGRGEHYLMKYQEFPLKCGDIYQLTPTPLRQTIEVRNDSSDCVWIFIAAADHALSIVTSDCKDESIEIRDGGTNLSPLISQTCPDSYQKLMTTNNLLFVKVKSNAKKNRIFQAHIEVVEKTCGGILRVENGVIVSPEYPLHISHRICNWKIIAPSKKRIVFQFHDLHLTDSPNCERKNYVRISERTSSVGTNKILGTFCGYTKPNIIKTSCNKATIQFRSDYHNIGNFRGFILNFTTIDEPCLVNCGGIITSDNGFISSPNFPNDYSPNLNCEWKIDVSPCKRIKFQFYGVTINDSPSCSEDYLQIKETVNGTDKNLALFCTDSIPMPISTSSSMAKVIFHSNERNEDSGFLLTYSAIDGPLSCNDTYPQSSSFIPALTSVDNDLLHGKTGKKGTRSGGCGGLLTAPEGIIKSQNHPSHYRKNSRCIWTVQAPPGHSVNLTWSYFNTEMTYDYVTLEETDGHGHSVNIGTYSGETIPSNIVTSTNVMIVMFHSDGSINRNGFSAKYSFT